MCVCVSRTHFSVLRLGTQESRWWRTRMHRAHTAFSAHGERESGGARALHAGTPWNSARASVYVCVSLSLSRAHYMCVCIYIHICIYLCVRRCVKSQRYARAYTLSDSHTYTSSSYIFKRFPRACRIKSNDAPRKRAFSFLFLSIDIFRFCLRSFSRFYKWPENSVGSVCKTGGKKWCCPFPRFCKSTAKKQQDKNPKVQICNGI